MRRHLIGIIALMSLVGAVVLAVRPPPGDWVAPLQSGFSRGGALAAVVWLAYADVRRMPAWFWASLPVLVIILVRWPKGIVYVIPVMVVLAILKPRAGRHG